jgi:hypothetical protein
MMDHINSGKTSSESSELLPREIAQLNLVFHPSWMKFSQRLCFGTMHFLSVLIIRPDKPTTV